VKPNTPKVGDLESFGTPECLEFDSKAQNTLHWGVLGVIGKVLKRRYRKWPRIGHLDIYSPSYGQKKGRESNWQFDSWPLKVGNRLLPDIRFESATRRWKVLNKGYNFGSDLVVIGLCSRELWASKVPGLQSGQFRDNFETPTWESQEKETIWGKVVASPDSGLWWVKWVQGCPWLVPTPKGCRMSSNQLVVGFDADSNKWIACSLPSLIVGTSSTTLYPFLVLEVGSVPQVPTFRNST
jgi:hypothetical protein